MLTKNVRRCNTELPPVEVKEAFRYQPRYLMSDTDDSLIKSNHPRLQPKIGHKIITRLCFGLIIILAYWTNLGLNFEI